MFFRRLVMMMCAVLLLSGCSVLPVKKSPNYSLEDLYRRVSYKTEGRYRVMNIFFATSREIDGGTAGSPRFRPELGKETTYGTVDMKIDPKLSIGTMLPDQIKNNELVNMERYEALSADAFFKKLSAAAGASPHKSILLLIFGYKDGFEANMIKAAYFSYLLDVNTPILVFDWPGDQSVDPLGYARAQSLARDSGPYLSGVIANIARRVKLEKFWLEASSMGAEVACSALHAIYNNPEFANSEEKIDHIIFAAPDVGKDEFKNKFMEEFKFIGKKLTAYVSSEDNALLVSGVLNQRNRLGSIKARVAQPKELEAAKELLYLKSLEPDRLTAIDVTPVNVSSFKHGYYLECPEFYDDFYMRLLNPNPNTSRCLYLLKTKDGVDYWVMQRQK